MKTIRKYAYQSKLSASLYLIILFAIVTALIQVLPAFISAIWIILSLTQVTFDNASKSGIIRTIQIAGLLTFLTYPNRLLQNEVSNCLGLILK